jgi:uroporphyrinogen III methyltransferase/synthase
VSQVRGRVLLVGAGPGAADLLTVRGAAALRRADAVVYDALAAPELLDLAPAHAERIDVGKRGHDAPTRPQDEINALLIRLARQGKTVVRLKGGDPFVFGRGGEECSALFAAGVPFEVVPGVSSVEGALACAGIPLTDRRHAASFAVVTGHKDPTRVTAETRWEELARAADTLVVVMGMRNLESLVERLLAGGRAPGTPAAAVMDGSLPRQRVVEASLVELPRRVREAGLSAPAVVVVGDVVRLRPELAWFERRPLFGRRVLVTRPADQSRDMLDALREAGAEPILVPMIRIEPPEDWSAADAALRRIADYDFLVFGSANAVRALAERGRALGVPPVRWRGAALCVGPLTAEAARGHGLAVAPLTPEPRDAESLLAGILRAGSPAGRRFLVARAAEGRPIVEAGLREAGGAVDAVAVYRTLPAAVDAAALRARLAEGSIDVLTFASPSAARAFAALLDPPAREAARRCLTAAIGRVTAEALRVEGLGPDVVPERADATLLVAAVADALAGGGRR